MSHPLKSLSHVEDPDHSILEKASSYQIVGMRYERNLDDEKQSFIDLVLQKDNVVRRLRFFAPQDIHVASGFPHGEGLFISDTSARGLDGLNVRVGDYEASGGGIWFWAREVIDLDQSAQ